MVIVTLIVFSNCSCVIEYNSDNTKRVDGVAYVFNSIRKTCFAADYQWDEKEKNITINIPDEVDGYKVESLGGFVDIGGRYPFAIYPPYDENAAFSESEEETEEDIVYEKIPVTIRLGKNVKELQLIDMQGYYEGEENTYKFIVKFEIDEENPYFKADENGKLIYSEYSPEYIDYFYYIEDE